MNALRLLVLVGSIGSLVACDMDAPGTAPDRDDHKIDNKIDKDADKVDERGDAAAAVDGVAAANPPFQQAENAADVDITAEIRRQVLDHDNLGVNADNAKIMTAGGVVTLRGRVDSDAEKQAIEAIARGVSGVTRVQNELEIGPQ